MLERAVYLSLSSRFGDRSLRPAFSERRSASISLTRRKTGNRIKYRKVDADTGDEVEASDIIKDYEVGKGEYIEVNPEELEGIGLENKRTIEIDEFVLGPEAARRILSNCESPKPADY